MKATYSHNDDAGLANPFGPPALGWREVAETMARAASHYRDGRVSDFERVAGSATPDLAYIVEIERYEARWEDATTCRPWLCESLLSFALRMGAGRSCTVTRTPLRRLSLQDL